MAAAEQSLNSGDPREGWLRAFHAADRKLIAEVYEEHYDAVHAAVRRRLDPSDAENAVHEVFFRLLSDEKLRENFEGGNLRAWITRVAINQAIDSSRRRCRETITAPDDAFAQAERLGSADPFSGEEEREAAALVDRFRRDCLPAKWHAVFEARFLRQLSQRDAAQTLGMQRTTLVYCEIRIRALLRKFLLKTEQEA